MTATVTRSVFLHEVEVICSIGLHDFERAEKQRVLIDVELRLDASNEPTADTVADTLDYDEVRNAVIALAEARHYDLQETLARHIFDAISAMRDVVGVSVQTQKPDVYPNCKTVAYRLSNLGLM
ncbi:MAG: dihydroneopterin aldolase [Alphaproteobacteria bacterium]|nr:dihydroneopterin aldolase [Alphaproteobacteria bacterium]